MKLVSVSTGTEEEQDVWYKKMNELEANVRKAVFELAGHTGGTGFMIPLPGTTPVVYVAMGPADSLARLLADVSVKGGSQ